MRRLVVVVVVVVEDTEGECFIPFVVVEEEETKRAGKTRFAIG